MLSKNLLRHIREFRQYAARKEYEVLDSGIYFPKAHALLGGVYESWVNDDMSTLQSCHNLIPDEGLNHVLGVALSNVAKVTTWYMALYANAYTPTPSLTASLFPATAGEITSTSQGYSGANRITWIPDSIDTVNTEISNTASPAAFTIVTASTLVVNGAALLSYQTRGSQSGVLVSAGRFPAERNLSDTDTFNVRYKVDVDAV